MRHANRIRRALTELQPFDATNPEHLGIKGQIQSQYLVSDFHTEGLEQAWTEFIWFENSAHDVFYDEPEAFVQEIVRLAQQVLGP